MIINAADRTTKTENSSTRTIEKNFDCIVVLGQNLWSMPGKNSPKDIVYTLRRKLPVVLVLPIAAKDVFKIKKYKKNLFVIRISDNIKWDATKLINQVLLSLRFISPIILTFNHQFYDYVIKCHSKYKIAFLTDDIPLDIEEDVLEKINLTLAHVNLILYKEPIEKEKSERNFAIPKATLQHIVKSKLTEILEQQYEKVLQRTTRFMQPKANVLMLYDEASIHVQTIYEHLKSFEEYSRHRYMYLPATRFDYDDLDLNFYNVIVVHYSIRICFDNHLKQSFENKIKQFSGLKILFMQDDYDFTENARKRMQVLGFHLIYTFVPSKYINNIYPKKRFPHTKFKPTLTGFVPDRLAQIRNITPIAERPLYIVYRGRKLPYSYGSLAYEKYIIGTEMKRICSLRNIPIDIEVDDANRIYGKEWYEFLAGSRATLATETGSNLFDFDGSVTANIKQMTQKEPDISFAEIYEEHIKPFEKDIDIHELSPKVFEAIAVKTALILFEGEYSGILKPFKHYIPLKKDFSNINTVLELLNDINFLEKIVNKAYEDIVESNDYSYSKFIQTIDGDIDDTIGKVFVYEPYNQVLGFVGPSNSDNSTVVSDTPFYSFHQNSPVLKPNYIHQPDSMTNHLYSKNIDDLQNGTMFVYKDLTKRSNYTIKEVVKTTGNMISELIE